MSLQSFVIEKQKQEISISRFRMGLELLKIAGLSFQTNGILVKDPGTNLYSKIFLNSVLYSPIPLHFRLDSGQIGLKADLVWQASMELLLGETECLDISVR